DGALTSPHFDAFKDSAHAYHDSTLAYGTWSFDWEISGDNRSFDAVEFILSDTKYNYNWTGIYELDKGIMGYGLALGSYNVSSVNSATPGLDLIKLYSNNGLFTPVSLKSHSFDGPIEGTHHIDITRSTDGEFKVYFDSDMVIQTTDNQITTSEKFAFTSWIGASSISNIVVLDDVPITVSDSINPLITLFAIISLGGLGYYLVKYFSYKTMNGRLIFNKHLMKHIIEIIDHRPYLLYLIFGESLSDNREIRTELRNSVPQEIFNHKFLMNPVRLAITKLLYENTELTSTEIKETLQISWSHYSNHVKALKKQDYIHIRQEFRDESVKQILTLRPKGHEKYSALIDLLQQFLDQTDTDDIYHKKEKDTFQWISERYLYPNKNT
ncbi:MAG: transcriptional regulator, partial [Candidatus Kariarchaeaceae archaeon]